jgi:hypothetical protein
MADDVRSRVIIDGDARGARRALTDTGKGLNDVAMQAKGLTGGLGSAMQSIAGLASSLPMALAGGAAVMGGIFASIIKNSIDAADEMSKMSAQVGITTESLSTLGYAADLSGVGTEALNTSLLKFNKNISEAAEGTGEAKETFEALGFSLKDSNGKLINTEDALLKVADQFAKMPAGAEKSRMAMDLFGRSGAALIPLLDGGSAGIKELTDEAERFGYIMDSETAKQAEKFNDDMSRLGYMVKGSAIQLMTVLLPALISVGEGLGDLLSAFTSLFKTTGSFDTFIDQAEKVKTLEDSIPPLLGRYDELITKTNKNTEEQTELKDIIIKLGEQFPQAITQVDDYGKAISVNTDKVKEWLEAEKARLAFINKEAIEETRETIAEAERERADLQYRIENNLRGTVWDRGKKVDLFNFNEDQIRGFQERIKELTGDIEGAEAQLKFLTGETDSYSKAVKDAEVSITGLTEEQIKAAEEAEKAAKKLREEWEKTLESMGGERAKAYMNETAFKFYQIEERADAAIEKFKSIPGAAAKINEWAQAMRIAAVEAEKLSGASAIAPKIAAPESLPSIDTTALDAYYQRRLEQSIEVTDAELANLALLDSRTSDVFGSMTGAMEAFYSLSGNRATAAFQLYKAFAIAETTINTYQAAVAAYKSAAEIPLVGPVAAPFAASAAIAYGIAQVAKITSAGFGGGVSGGGASAPNLPSAYSGGGTSGGRSSGEDRPQIIEVHIHSAVFDQKTWDDVAPNVIKAINNGTRRGIQLTAVQ